MVRSGGVLDNIPRHCKDLIEDLEIENALDLVQRFREFVHRSGYPLCVKMILANIVNGDYKQFRNCVDSACSIAQQRISSNGRSGRSAVPLTTENLRRRIYDNILKAGCDTQRDVTLFMYLSVHHGGDLKCQSVDHGYCRILQDLTINASPTVVREQLMIQTKIDRTALHYAATTGQACQLATLLNAGIYLDPTDKSGRTPLHYAIERSSRLLVLCLLLAGADMSKSQKTRPCYSPRLLSTSHSNTIELGQYLNRRMEYLQWMFMEWVAQCGGPVFTPDKLYSEVHCMRLSRDSDNLSTVVCSPEDMQRSVCMDVDNAILNMPKDNDLSLSLIMFPAFYRLRRERDDSCGLDLCRTDFHSPGKQVEKVIAGRVLLKGAYLELFLESEIVPEHNGYYYMYHLPKTMVPGPHELYFNLDSKRLSAEQLHSTFFVLGVVAIRRNTSQTVEQNPQRSHVRLKQKCD